MKSGRILLKDIAAEVGLSIQAVSMALRGHKRIATATRARVKEAATRLGYEVDPALSALARYRTSQLSGSRKWDVITLLTAWETPTDWLTFEVNRRLLAALHQEAASRGIALEEAWAGPDGKATRRVLRKLGDSGRHALLLGPSPPSVRPRAIALPATGNFQAVSFGPAHLYPRHHVVDWDHYENLCMAWRRLSEMGCRRIGLVYLDRLGWRIGKAGLGAYLAEQALAGQNPANLPPLVLDGNQDVKRFRSWLGTFQPDAVITGLQKVLEWPGASDRPVAILDAWQPGHTGINLNVELAARTAIELLTLNLQKALVSHHNSPFRIQIPGYWVEPEKPPI